MEQFSRHYEAAQPGRRTDNWPRNYMDADNNIRGALSVLRAHARDLLRNNGWARRARQVVAGNTVGTGISAKALGPEAPKAMQLWRRWANTLECETEGRHTFAGIQRLAMRSIFESGEVLIRRRTRKAKDDLSIPIQLQILEADYLDHSRTMLDSQSGGPIIQGVEFDKIGRRSAYWLYDRHPGSGRNFSPSKRVSAADVIHVYFPDRPGQVRGVSWLAAATLNLKDSDEFEDATLMRQKVAALFAGFVTDMEGLGAPIGAGSEDPEQPLEDTLEPGLISYLPPGKDVKFSNPPLTPDGSFSDRILRKIASGIGVTFEDMTGDYSKVNFSSARMARIAHYQNVEEWRGDMLIPHLCDGVWTWAMEAAALAGEIAEVPEVRWTPPPVPMIEPDKEGLAIQRMVRNGLKTQSEAIREQGQDPDEIFQEIADDNATLDRLKLILDSDPRKTTQQGQGENLLKKAADPLTPSAQD